MRVVAFCLATYPAEVVLTHTDLLLLLHTPPHQLECYPHPHPHALTTPFTTSNLRPSVVGPSFIAASFGELNRESESGTVTSGDPVVDG